MLSVRCVSINSTDFNIRNKINKEKQNLNKQENGNDFIVAVVVSTVLVACDEQGTPIIGEHGEKICNCAEPWQSLFPDNKYYCLNCWGEWYH